MHRPDSPFVTPEGLFKDGSPPGDPASLLQSKFMNTVVLEMENLVLAGGLALDDADNTQLLQAILRLNNSAGFRNGILNPSGAIARRMPSAGEWSLSAEGRYTFDRWIADCGDGAATIAHDTNDTAASGNPQSSGVVMHWDQTGSSTQAPLLKQRIWALAAYSDRTVTLSFMAHAAAALTITPTLVQHFGIGGAADVVVAANEGPVNLTTGWQRFVRTFTMPSVYGKSVGSGSKWTELVLAMPTGATFEWWAAEVQAELAPHASEFEDRLPTLEQLLTSRFCRTSYAGVAGSRIGDSIYAGCISAREAGDGGAGLVVAGLQRPIEMRTQPTVTWYSPDTGAAGKVHWGGADRDVTQTNFSGRTSTGVPVVAASPAGDALAYAHYLAEAEL